MLYNNFTSLHKGGNALDASSTPGKIDGEQFGKLLGDIVTKYIVPVMLGMVILWCIWVGVKFLIAKGDSERIAAKRHFFMAVSSVMIFTMLCGMLFGLTLAFKPNPNGETDLNPNPPPST
ncbi:MAG: hypothetical protein LBG88_00375, partial [Christensenellaceae bacterium]|nr:hypothetical protein [Christensenellaceae bacterium]